MAGKVVKQLAGSGTGQSFMDRMNAAKYSISGSDIAKVVCKSTTEEIAPPKRKHLNYLINCTNETNVSVPELADSLIARAHTSSWIVSFKALITIHNLMNLGNERFSQYIASNSCQISICNFTDKTSVQSYDMSVFIRNYSKYVSQKAVSYKMMAFDFCKIKRGKEEGIMRNMTGDKLLKALPVLEKQLDTLIEFEASANELNNQVINAAFLLLYKDLIRLFASYNEGMISLIEKYFSMNKKNCREALTLYKKFIQRMDKVNSFLKTAETIGIGDKESLSLTPVPLSVLEALENHLLSLEGRKITSDRVSYDSGSIISSSPNKKDPIFSTNFSDNVEETERRRIIEIEALRLAEFASKNNRTNVSPQVSRDIFGEQADDNFFEWNQQAKQVHTNDQKQSQTLQNKAKTQNNPPNSTSADLLLLEFDPFAVDNSTQNVAFSQSIPVNYSANSNMTNQSLSSVISPKTPSSNVDDALSNLVNNFSLSSARTPQYNSNIIHNSNIPQNSWNFNQIPAQFASDSVFANKPNVLHSPAHTSFSNNLSSTNPFLSNSAQDASANNRKSMNPFAN